MDIDQIRDPLDSLRWYIDIHPHVYTDVELPI
jgi:hypothetical protein